MGFSALVVPVPAADWLVAGRTPVPAHVTLLTPFLDREALTDGVLDELAAIFCDVTPFPFALDGVSRFPDGAVYLAPDPAGPFRHLTQALVRAFPEHPPYGGRFDDVVPHVTVPPPVGEDPRDPEDTARRVAAHGPLRALAVEAWLVWAEGEPVGSLDVLARFAFGTVAA